MKFKIQRFVVGEFSTNCYLLTFLKKNISLLIDAGEGISSVIEKNTLLHLKGALLTHAHIDHIEGLNEIDAPVYIMDKEKDALYDPYKNLSSILGRNFVVDANKKVYPLKEGEVCIAGIDFKVIHTPGHTIGSCCYLFDNILFSGDTLFYHTVGRTDIPGGNYRELISSIKKKIFTLPLDTQVLPGHGEETKILEEMQFNPHLAGWRNS